MPRTAQEVLDEYAEGKDVEERAESFLELDRWWEDDPVLLLASAAGTSTGQDFADIVKPKIEEFRDEFVRTGKINSFEGLSRMDMEGSDLEGVFTHPRKKRILIEGARQLHEPGEDDLSALQDWAENADPWNYDEEKIGRIDGVGLRTFQYLRMLSGVDTAKPDIKVRRFLEKIDPEVDMKLSFSEDIEALESCIKLADNTTYTVIEIDQIAWWSETDIDEY